jgi:hypothetical protein
MPIRMAPWTLRASSAAMRMNAATAMATAGVLTLPSVTSVTGSAAINPVPCMPMTARNRPMPADMAIFNDLEMLSIIHWRTGVTLTRRNSKPEANTAASAACHGRFMPFTTEYVK